MNTNLDPMFARNAHILYSAQKNYIGPAHHKKEFIMLDADENGNLYNLGAISRLWISIKDLFTCGRTTQEMNERVKQAIRNTVTAINAHLERINKHLDEHDKEINAGNVSKINDKLYITPHRGFRVERVHRESLFLLDLKEIAHFTYEDINMGVQVVSPFKDLVERELQPQMKQLHRTYKRIEDKIIQKDANLELAKVYNCDPEGGLLNRVKAASYAIIYALRREAERE